MRDLLTDPCWQASDLGDPLPNSPHAVSVAMPLWEHVVAYEEEDPRVTSKLRCGYPRFFLPPLVQQFFREAERRFAKPGEGCLVYPSRASAERCAEYVQKRADVTPRIEAVDGLGLNAVVFPEDKRRIAREDRRFTGETVSTRFAAAALSGAPDDPVAGTEAKTILRRRLARLAGVGESDVFLFPSGMAAVFAVHRAIQKNLPGRRTVQLDFPYVDVLKVQQEFGAGVEFYPTANDAVLAEMKALAQSGELSGVFCEMPSNPLLRCVRLSEFSGVLHAAGVPLIVDDTVATVANIDALKFADAVTTSLTKSFSGAGDVMAGAVTLNPRSAFYNAFRAELTRELETNDLVWWEDAVVLEKNSRDFPKRARRSSRNAAALVEMLAKHPAVEAVYYPKFQNDGIDEILRPGGEYGCLFSFVLRDPKQAPAVYDALRVSKGPSLGTNFTLACPYTLLAHYRELDWAKECGVASHLIRVSAGLEEEDDLLQRFAEALLS